MHDWEYTLLIVTCAQVHLHDQPGDTKLTHWAMPFHAGMAFYSLHLWGSLSAPELFTVLFRSAKSEKTSASPASFRSF